MHLSYFSGEAPKDRVLQRTAVARRPKTGNHYLPMANDDYIGKHVLVGLTYVDHTNTVTKQAQLHGTITRITDEGIFFEPANGEGEFSLPPDVDSLRPAKPGEYRLRSTGEVVVDPDYVSSWTINAQPPGDGR